MQVFASIDAVTSEWIESANLSGSVPKCSVNPTGYGMVKAKAKEKVGRNGGSFSSNHDIIKQK